MYILNSTILLAKSEAKPTQVEELDLPEDECVTDRSYDFHRCVRQSYASQVSAYIFVTAEILSSKF